MHPAVEKARLFATGAHAAVNQRRKYTGEPYITHPAAVVDTLYQCGASVELLCAGWLHDVVEDTQVPLTHIEAEFGPRVAQLVSMVTSPRREPACTRAEHQAWVRAHASLADAEGKTLKLADVLDNVSSLVERDPVFARRYIPEKILLLEELRGGHEALWQAVSDQLALCMQQLEQIPRRAKPYTPLATLSGLTPRSVSRGG